MECMKTIKLIKVGTSNVYGDIYKEYEHAKSCQFCNHFIGCGLHACAAICALKSIRIEGGYTGGYRETALKCDSFDCKYEHLAILYL